MPADDARFMRLAIDACRRGIAAGQAPFGALIVDPSGAILAEAHNTVLADLEAKLAPASAAKTAAGDVAEVITPSRTR